MNDKLTQVITELEAQLELVNGDIAEYNEIWGGKMITLTQWTLRVETSTMHTT